MRKENVFSQKLGLAKISGKMFGEPTNDKWKTENRIQRTLPLELLATFDGG
jgi:hypothetical protein